MTEKEALSIYGRAIKYEIRMVDIYDLHFYEKNPRVATIASEYRGHVTDEIIDKALWERPDTHKWKRRIEKDGGLIHPLIVYEDKVLEGNTRLCCYRHLYEELKDENWRQVRCQVIIDPLSRDDIYRLLATEHIEGKTPWDAYDKANWFREMKEEDGMTLEQISELAGESTASIWTKIKAYNLMVANRVIEKEKYSHFEQLILSPDIRAIKKQDPKIDEKVVSLIKNGAIRKATDVRYVGTIWKHKGARDRLFKHKEDAEQIYIDVKAKAPMTDSPLMQDVEDLIKRIRSITREQRDSIVGNNRDCSKIHQLARELISFCEEMGIKVYVPKKIRKG